MINRIFRCSTRISDFSPKLFEQSPWIFGRQVPMFFARDITRTPWDTMGHRWTSRPGLALQHFCGSTEVQDPSDADLSDADLSIFSCLTYR
jgi:hypothetical protein